MLDQMAKFGYTCNLVDITLSNHDMVGCHGTLELLPLSPFTFYPSKSFFHESLSAVMGRV